MRDLLVALLALAGCLALGALAATLLGIVRIRRGNRLLPDIPTPAPLSWRWSWHRAAHLHRRLRRTCRLVSASVAIPELSRRRRRRQSPSPLAGVAEQLVADAVALDRRIVVASRAPDGWRRPALAALAGEVRALEAAATRLAGLSASWRRHLDSLSSEEVGRRPLAIEARLDAVEAAFDELRPVRRESTMDPAGGAA